MLTRFWGLDADDAMPVQDGPSEFTLVNQDDEDKKSVVVIEARYLPVPLKLEARESVNSTRLSYRADRVRFRSRCFLQTRASCVSTSWTATASAASTGAASRKIGRAHV